MDFRTNNHVEGWHHMISSYFGKHDNIWLFIERLKLLEHHSFMYENQYDYHGIKALKPGKLLFRINNSSIDLLIIEFDSGRKSAVA